MFVFHSLGVLKQIVVVKSITKPPGLSFCPLHVLFYLWLFRYYI